MDERDERIKLIVLGRVMRTYHADVFDHKNGCKHLSEGSWSDLAEDVYRAINDPKLDPRSLTIVIWVKEGEG